MEKGRDGEREGREGEGGTERGRAGGSSEGGTERRRDLEGGRDWEGGRKGARAGGPREADREGERKAPGRVYTMDFLGFDGQKKRARFVTLTSVVSAVCIAQN